VNRDKVLDNTDVPVLAAGVQARLPALHEGKDDIQDRLFRQQQRTSFITKNKRKIIKTKN
jgi:hypothetical protein